MNTKNVQNQLEVSKETNRQRIQNALEYVTFAIPDTTEVVKEKRFEIDF